MGSHAGRLAERGHVAGSDQLCRNYVHIDTRKADLRFYILIAFLAMGVTLQNVSALAEIQFISPTPANNSINTTGYIFVNTSITSSDNSSAFFDYDNSLVGWWRFNNESGESSSSFADWSPNKNNATCNSCPLNESGWFGNSLNFTVGNNLTIPHSDSFIFNSNITISARIKISNSTNTYFNILSKNTNTGFTNLLAVRGSDGFTIWYIPGVNNWAIASFPYLKNGDWQHITATYNGSKMVLYINGTQRAITSATGSFLWDTNPLTIGKSAADTYPFNGSLDDVMIFNRALDNIEVAALYNSTANRPYRNFTSQLDGNHSIKAYYQNTTGYVNNTEFRNIKIAVNPDCSNISYYNWIIYNDTVCSDATSTFTNGIFIYNGTLTLNNVTYSMQGNIISNVGSNISINESDLVFRYGTVLRFTTYGSSSKIINSNISTKYLNDSLVSKTTGDLSDRVHLRIYGNNFQIEGSNLSYMSGMDYTSGGSRGGVHFWNVNNGSIKNSTFVNNNQALHLMASSNIVISGNTFHDSTKWMPIYLWGNTSTTSDITIKNNTFYNEDRIIQMTATKNITFENNTASNITMDWDNYDVGIFLNRENDNITIKNNNLTGIGTAGIIGFKSTNVTISNNNIDNYNLYTKSSTFASDFNEPVIGIGFVETYKGLDSTSTESDTDNRTNTFSAYKSSDISISGNTFGSNVQVLLYTQGTQDLTHDISNYWKHSYYLPEMFDQIDLYISNNFSNLSSLARLRTKSGVSSKAISEILQSVFVSTSTNYRVFFNYSAKPGNFTIYPQNWIRYWNGTVAYLGYYDFNYYGDGGVFGLSKENTVFPNGTIYIQLLNDTLEPNGYHTLNMTILPSSNSIVVNVTIWNITGDYRKVWNESSSNAATTAQHTIGDFTANQWVQLKKNSVNLSLYQANSSGYISFLYSSGYSEIQLEAIAMSDAAANSEQIDDDIASMCYDTKQWGVSGFALIPILFVAFGGALALGFLTGTLKIETEHIMSFVLMIVMFLVVGAVGMFMIVETFNITGC